MKTLFIKTTIFLSSLNGNYIRNMSNTPNNNLPNVTPVVTYNNADTHKLDILGDNRKKAGVYR